MTVIVDYGVGNLFSLQSSLRTLGLETEVTGEAERLRAAERTVSYTPLTLPTQLEE